MGHGAERPYAAASARAVVDARGVRLGCGGPFSISGTRGRVARPIVKSGDTLGRTKEDRAIRAVIGQSRASRNSSTRALRLECA